MDLERREWQSKNESKVVQKLVIFLPPLLAAFGLAWEFCLLHVSIGLAVDGQPRGDEHHFGVKTPYVHKTELGVSSTDVDDHGGLL